MDFDIIHDIEKIAKDIHTQNIEKGFWEEVNSRNRQICLINSELYEAIEADRKNKFADIQAFENFFKISGGFSRQGFLDYMKDTLQDEFADTWIRIVDYHYYLQNEGITDIPFKNITNFQYYPELEDNVVQINSLVLKIGESLRFLNFARTAIQEFCKSEKIYLEKHVQYKMKYNSFRPKYHAKAY